MPKELLYSELIRVPETVGTRYYKTQITTDKLYNYVSGICCMLSDGVVDGADIEMEIRDDNRALFSFSPAANWIKTANNSGWDMTQIFRPCKMDSKGKNLYITVKATDCAAFSFVIYLRQTVEPLRCIDYNFQSYDVRTNSNNLFTLPSNYKFVNGVQIALPDSADEKLYQMRIEDSRGNLLDNIILSAIKVRSNLHYDRSFYPVCFPGDARDAKIYITKIDGTAATAFNAKVCFLVTNISK